MTARYSEIVYAAYKMLWRNRSKFPDRSEPPKKHWSYALFVGRYPEARDLFMALDKVENYELSENQGSMAIRLFCYNDSFLESLDVDARM